MTEAADSGAALILLGWAEEDVDGLERIKYRIVSAWQIFFGQFGSLGSLLVGSILLGAR